MSTVDTARAVVSGMDRCRSAPISALGCSGTTAADSKKAVLSSMMDCVFTIAVMGFGVAIIQGVATIANLGMIDKGSLTFALSVSCPCIIIAQFISPAAVVVEAVSTMDARNLPTQVFQSQAVCNVLGISYAVQIRNYAVLASNMVGLSCQIVYLACASYIANEDASWTWWCFQMVVMLNSSLCALILVSPIRILGHLITVFNVVLFASPLTKVAKILRARDASSLPTPMTVVGLLSNGVWTLYSMMIEDFTLFLPSLLGFLLSSFQVLLILWCRRVLPFDLTFLLMFCGTAEPDGLEMAVAVQRTEVHLDEEVAPLVEGSPAASEFSMVARQWSHTSFETKDSRPRRVRGSRSSSPYRRSFNLPDDEEAPLRDSSSSPYRRSFNLPDDKEARRRGASCSPPWRTPTSFRSLCGGQMPGPTVAPAEAAGRLSPPPAGVAKRLGEDIPAPAVLGHSRVQPLPAG